MTKKRTRPPSAQTKLRKEKLARAMDEHVAQEELILSVAEEFYVMMDELGLTRTSCARQLRVPESHVKRILEGRNMTLRTLASVLFTLGYRAEVRFAKVA